MNILKLSSIIFLSICTLFFAAHEAQAQSVITLRITPPSAYVHVKPGSTATHTITLENTGHSALVVQPKIVDFFTDGKTGLPQLRSSTSFPFLVQESSLADEPYFEPMTLPAGQTAQLTLQLGIPANAAEKEWPLTVLFEATQAQPLSLAESGSQVRGAIGSNLIVLVSHRTQLPQELAIESLGAPVVIDSFAELEFTPLLKNAQFATTVASGSATIHNWLGQQVAQFELYPTTILGFSSREVLAATSQENGSIAPIPPKHTAPFLIGPYRITLNLTNSSGQTYVSHTQTSLALPYFFLLILFLILAAAIPYWILRKKSLHF